MEGSPSVGLPLDEIGEGTR